MGHRPQPTCHRAQASGWGWGWGWGWFFPRVGQSFMAFEQYAVWRLGVFLLSCSDWMYDICMPYIYFLYYSRYVAASVGFNIVYEASPQSKRKELNSIWQEGRGKARGRTGKGGRRMNHCECR